MSDVEAEADSTGPDPATVEADCLNALARSVLDQHDAATVEAEHRWPYNNAVFFGVQPVENRLLDAQIGPDPESSWGHPTPPGQITLNWCADGSVTPVGPGMDVRALARSTYPLVMGQASTCDLCGMEEIPWDGMLFAFGSKIIGLVFCDGCARHINQSGLEPVWLFRTTQTQLQGDSQ